MLFHLSECPPCSRRTTPGSFIHNKKQRKDTPADETASVSFPCIWISSMRVWYSHTLDGADTCGCHLDFFDRITAPLSIIKHSSYNKFVSKKNSLQAYSFLLDRRVILNILSEDSSSIMLVHPFSVYWLLSYFIFMVPDVTISSIRTVAMVIASSLLQSICYC